MDTVHGDGGETCHYLHYFIYLVFVVLYSINRFILTPVSDVSASSRCHHHTRSSYCILQYYMNKATLSGASDIIVVWHRDGSLRSTPWYFTFGKIKLFSAKSKDVNIYINDVIIDLKMTLDGEGRGVFEQVCMLSRW